MSYVWCKIKTFSSFDAPAVFDVADLFYNVYIFYS